MIGRTYLLRGDPVKVVCRWAGPGPRNVLLENGREVDAFIVYTDSETWAGSIHPAQALAQYRQRSGIEEASLIVVGMEGNRFTIADPTDPRMLDVVGFDTGTPRLMGDFIAGRV